MKRVRPLTPISSPERFFLNQLAEHLEESLREYFGNPDDIGIKYIEGSLKVIKHTNYSNEIGLRFALKDIKTKK